MKNKKNSVVLLCLLCVIVLQNLYSFETNTRMVDSYNIIEQRLEKKEYDSIAEYYAYPVTIRLSNFKKVLFASILPVYAEDRGWVRAQFLEKGDRVLYLKDGKVSYKTIWSVATEKKMHVFYTLVDVQDTNTYFKDSVLVHNQVSHQTAGDSGNIQVADIIAASNNDDNNDDDDDSTTNSGPSEAQQALQAASHALAEANALGASFEEIVALEREFDQAQVAYHAEVEEEKAMQAAEQAGDPVLVTTGTFLHEEVDVSHRGGLSQISITRHYESSNDNLYTMGRAWASLLDSRIIRGFTYYEKGSSSALFKIMEKLKAIQSRLESRKKYKAASNAYNSIQAQYNEMNTLYQKLLSREKNLNSIMELNRFALTQKNEAIYNSLGDGFLAYIDEKGLPEVFTYKGNGVWLPINIQKAQYMRITSRDGSDVLTQTGFVLHEKGGKKTFFDKWGLIEKILDNNNNEVVFIRNNATKALEKIQTPEGKSFDFEYNRQGFLETIQASDGKRVQYEYAGNNLAAVTDIDGDKSSFIYNAKGLLIRLIKPDGSYVSFTYGLQNTDGKYLTTSTTNEEGFSELFQYDLKNNRTIYTDHTGFSEYIYYDDKHRTVKKIDKVGKITTFTYDNSGNVSSMNVNGSLIRYSYDTRGNKTQEAYSDGSKKTWVYNSFDQVTRYTDRDGIVQSIFYDAQGNAVEYKNGSTFVERAIYNTKGTITKLIDYNGNETLFTYDSSYNVIQKKTGDIVEKFEYDKSGNLTKYIDGENRTYTYTYDAKKIVQISPEGLQRTYFLNNRKDVIRMQEVDTITNEKRVFNYDYDKRHLLLSVKQGDKTLVHYTYYPAGQVKTETYGEKGKEDYWVIEYEYHSSTSYSVHKKKFTKDGIQDGSTSSETFTSGHGGKTLIYEIPLIGKKIFSFDAWNRLTTVENPIGEKVTRKLSHEGRVLEEQSAFGGLYKSVYNSQGLMAFSSEAHKDGITIEYNPDGSISSKTNQNGNVTHYRYNPQGFLIQEKKDSGSTFYTYDAIGRLLRIIVGNTNSIENAEQYTEFEYSKNSRALLINYGGVHSEMLLLNAWGELVEKIDGENNSFSNSYNNLGQIIASIDAYGNKTEYSYNAIGKVSKVQFSDGMEESYTYNALFQLQSVKDSVGVQWHGTFDNAGRLIQEYGRNLVEKTYEYDSLNRITKVRIADKTIEEYKYSQFGKTIVFTDGKNNDYMYTLDSYGRLVFEKNRLGNSQQYNYDSAGQLVKKTDFANGVQTIEMDERILTTTHRYSDKSESVYTYNSTGNLIGARNATGGILYTYNTAGLLESQTDETSGEHTRYMYDKAGRRIRYISGNRDVVYEYGKNGELLRVNDNSQRLSVSYTYDTMMREIKRIFANGVEQHTMYDSIGRTILIVEKNSSGEVLRCEGYVYNDIGQIHLKVDEKAYITKYEYDAQGRLKTVLYPYSDEKVLFDKEEIAQSGIFITENMKQAELMQLTNTEVNEAKSLLNMMSYGRSNALRSMQTVWKESYTYDENSNRLTKTTAWGTIKYTYDAENRLTHSGVQGSGTSFIYDANGNVLTKHNAYTTEEFLYNGTNRMAKSIVTDNIQKTKVVTHYAYDAFGRRNMTQNEGFSTMRTLYDGLSHDIIREAEVFANGSFTTNYVQQGLEYRTRETSIERYLFVEENTLSEVNKNVDEYKSINDRFTGAKTSLYAKGEVVGISYSESGQRKTLYFGSDILGSIRSSTQDYAQLENRYDYDAFGNPYAGEFTTGLNNGYTGKPFDTTTNLYNYGYRDYSPQQARFTTVDPIREGNNWFSYVVNDPVNFVDMWGLSASDIGNWIDNGDGTYTAQAGAMLWELNATGQNWTDSDYVGKPEDLQVGQTVSFGQTGSATPAPTRTASVWDDLIESGSLYNIMPSRETPIWPTDSKRVTSTMGVTHRFGIDIGAMQAGERGDTIVAVESGVVIYSGLADVPKSVNGSSYVDIRTLSGDVHVYVHMDNITVSKGDIVLQGNKLGEMSDIGSPDQVHLHFEVHKGGKRVNPLGIFSDNITDNLEYVK